MRNEEKKKRKGERRLEVGEGLGTTMLILLLCDCLLCPFLSTIFLALAAQDSRAWKVSSADGKERPGLLTSRRPSTHGSLPSVMVDALSLDRVGRVLLNKQTSILACSCLESLGLVETEPALLVPEFPATPHLLSSEGSDPAVTATGVFG